MIIQNTVNKYVNKFGNQDELDKLLERATTGTDSRKHRKSE